MGKSENDFFLYSLNFTCHICDLLNGHSYNPYQVDTAAVCKIYAQIYNTCIFLNNVTKRIFVIVQYKHNCDVIKIASRLCCYCSKPLSFPLPIIRGQTNYGLFRLQIHIKVKVSHKAFLFSTIFSKSNFLCIRGKLGLLSNQQIWLTEIKLHTAQLCSLQQKTRI